MAISQEREATGFKSDMSRLGQDVGALKHDVGNLAHGAADAARSGAHAALDAAKDQYESAKGAASDAAASFKSTVSRNPMASVAVAAGVGLVIGLFLFRSRN